MQKAAAAKKCSLISRMKLGRNMWKEREKKRLSERQKELKTFL